MSALRRAVVLLGIAVPLPSLCARAQEPDSAQAPVEALRVFLDCNTFCDFDHLRREILYVNWVRDRTDAQVHLIATSQGTGGGGREFTFRFIGLGDFQGSDDELRFTTLQSDTDDEIRNQFAQRVGLGLARYLAQGPLASRVRIAYTLPEGATGQSQQQPRDPWDFWVFTVSMNGNFFGESRTADNFLSGSFRVRRVTDRWNFDTRVSGSRSHSRFTLSDTTVVRTTTTRYSTSSLLVRSLTDHWSLAVNFRARRSSVENFDAAYHLLPGIEYNVFPYRESSRRQLVFAYELGLTHADYAEETVFSKLRETRPRHSLVAAIEAVQPWGRTSASVTGSAYVDDWSQNRLVLEGGIRIRLIRGLELNLEGFYARVRDELSIAKEGATDQEVFLRLQQLQTSYRYFGFVGLSYTFGSKFNNIVNPRFTHSADFF